jgi:hypothetical protein
MGLLDALSSDSGLLGLYLMSAGAAKPQRTSLGEGLLGGLQMMQQQRQGREDRAARDEDRKQRAALQAMQMQQMQSAMAQQQQAQQAAQQAAARRGGFLDSINPQSGPAMPYSPAAALQAGIRPEEAKMLGPHEQENPFGKIDPKDYTPESLLQFSRTRDFTALRPNQKPEGLPTSAQEYNYAQKDPQFGAWLREQANLKAPKAPVVNIHNTDSAKAETDLRKEFGDIPQVKRFNSALPAYKAVEDAAKRNTTQADINLVYGIAKLYDPESVVREGEYATIANSQSIPEKIKGFASYVGGGGRLTPETKAQLMIEAKGRIGAFKTEVDAARKTYEGIAVRRKLDPQNVFIQQTDLPGIDSPSSPAPGDLASAAAAELARRRRGGK